MKILVAIDSFKGTMKSSDISELVKKHYQRKLNHDFSLLPISDGGEGFLNAIESIKGIKKVNIEVEGPMGQPTKSYYLMKDKTAFIELANSSGLSLLKESQRNPLQTSTYGLGQTIKYVLNEDIEHLVIGIGGSSTNDGGTGMLKALGLKFFDESNNEIDRMTGASIQRIKSIDMNDLDPRLNKIIVSLACDVTNPLLGQSGATYTYAKQKGADDQMIKKLEKAMMNYHEVVKNTIDLDFSKTPGSGAAGGVGYALKAFLKADIIPGIEVIADILDIKRKIKESDMVITGEGCLDMQTLQGKAPFRIAHMAKEYHKAVIGIFGQVNLNDKAEVFDQVYSIVPKYASLEESLKHPKQTLIKCLEDL
jgi:glycerate kinase